MTSVPILVINYKSYLSGIGERGIEIAKQAENISRELGVNIIVAVPFTLIPLVSKAVDIPVYAQHVDPLRPGRGTGYVTAKELSMAGARGSILNHSEHRLDITSVQDAIAALHEEGLKALVCADTPRAALAISILEPDLIAIEPPELIGTGIPVSKAKPEVIVSSISLLRGYGFERPILVGAGITNGDDARRSIELGAQGVLVASAVMGSSNPVDKIRELALGVIEGFRLTQTAVI